MYLHVRDKKWACTALTPPKTWGLIVCSPLVPLASYDENIYIIYDIMYIHSEQKGWRWIGPTFVLPSRTYSPV